MAGAGSTQRRRSLANTCGTTVCKCRSKAAGWQGGRGRVGLGATLAVALPQDLAHDLRDDRRQITSQTVDLAVQAVDLVLQAIHSGLDGGQIVAVAPSLIEDMTGHHLLALDLALNDIDSHRELRELVPGHEFGHGNGPPNPSSSEV